MEVEVGKVCGDTTTIPDDSSAKRGDMGGGCTFIYIYTRSYLHNYLSISNKVSVGFHAYVPLQF